MLAERTPTPDSGPRALKKYRLVGQLAKGGMAELFLARARGIGGFERLLVIKRILPELSRDPELVRMLLDEARTAATLQHANIVQVFDVDMVDGNVFFAMEYLKGQHVLAMLERARAIGARLPLENAIAIAVAVAAGLHYAHERWGGDGKPLGIVHRDVAPNNVIVTYDGNVKLIDFGIAKSANNLSSTRFGLFKGKLPYASPEQCRCEPVDRRTDVFSLGVLLYELTTGFPLFVADSEYELLRLMTEAIVPRPRMRDKAYPRELEKIVLKALARDPAERYQTAQALQLDLEVFAGNAELDLTAFSLSRLMSSLFRGELDDWRIAQSQGMTLEQHITKTTPNWTATDTATAWALPEDDDGAETIKHGQPVPTARVRGVPRRYHAIAAALLAAGALAGWVIAGAVHDEPKVVEPTLSTRPEVPTLSHDEPSTPAPRHDDSVAAQPSPTVSPDAPPPTLSSDAPSTTKADRPDEPTSPTKRESTSPANRPSRVFEGKKHAMKRPAAPVLAEDAKKRPTAPARDDETKKRVAEPTPAPAIDDRVSEAKRRASKRPSAPALDDADLDRIVPR